MHMLEKRKKRRSFLCIGFQLRAFVIPIYICLHQLNMSMVLGVFVLFVERADQMASLNLQ